MVKKKKDAPAAGPGGEAPPPRRQARSPYERSRETNKAVARRLLELWNERQESYLPPDLTSPGLITHFRNRVSAPAEEKTVRAQLETVVPGNAFRNQQFEEQVLIADDEYVFIGWEMKGTHDRPLYGHPATFKTVTTTGADVLRIQDGMIVEHWDFYTKARIHLLARLGLLDREMQKHLVVNELLGRNRATGRLRPEDLQAWLMV